MRATPIAFAAGTSAEADDAARRDAVLTHFDPAAGDASAALCAALRAIAVEGDPLEAARGTAQDAHVVRRWATSATGPRRSPRGGTANGVWPGRRSRSHFTPSPRTTTYRRVTFAISLGRDTDTNGAVTGALAGARGGTGSIPSRWLEALRERDRSNAQRARSPPTAASTDEFQRGALRRRPRATGADRRRKVSPTTAIAISRGRHAKNYRHTDPNEDVVACYSDGDRVVLVVADGHNGRESSSEAVAAVDAASTVCGSRRPPTRSSTSSGTRTKRCVTRHSDPAPGTPRVAPRSRRRVGNGELLMGLDGRL